MTRSINNYFGLAFAEFDGGIEFQVLVDACFPA